MDLPIEITTPEILIGFVLIAGPVTWWSLRALTHHSNLRQYSLITLRLLIIGGIFFSLSSPYLLYRKTRPVHRDYLIDVSYSIADQHWKNALNLVIRDAQKHLNREDDTGQLFSLARTNQPQASFRKQSWNPLPKKIRKAPLFPPSESDRTVSNIYRGLYRQMLTSRPKKTREIIIFTDGFDTIQHQQKPSSNPDVNDPSPVSEHLLSRTNQSTNIIRYPLPAGSSPDIKLLELETSPKTGFYQPLHVSGLIESHQIEQATITLSIGDQKRITQTVQFSESGKHHIPFDPIYPDQIFSSPPEHPIQIQLTVDPPPGKDFRSVDNSLSTHVQISPPEKILFLTSSPGQLQPLTHALEAQHLQSSVQTSWPGIQSLRKHHAIILHRPTDDLLSNSNEQQLLQYIQNGGSLMILSDSSDLETKWLRESTLSPHLPIRPIRQPASSSKNRTEETSSPPSPPEPKPEEDTSRKQKGKVSTVGLLLVMDRSGSMAGKKINLVREAAIATLETLSDRDTIGVLAFNEQTRWITFPISAARKSLFKQRIRRLKAGGGTNIQAALTTAAKAIEQIQSGIKHIILLSDGRTEPANFQRLVQKIQREGATISTVAVGKDAHDQLLSKIADWGNGSSYFTRDFNRIPQIFTMEARNVRKQARRPKRSPKQKDQESPPEDDDSSSNTQQHPTQDHEESSEPAEQDRTDTEQPELKQIFIAQHVPFLRDFTSDQIPPVRSLIRTEAHQEAIVPLRVQTRDKDPFFAYRYRGAGTILMLNTGFSSQEKSWFQWQKFPRFLSQILRRFAHAPGDDHQTEKKRTRNRQSPETLVTGLSRTFFHEDVPKNRLESTTPQDASKQQAEERTLPSLPAPEREVQNKKYPLSRLLLILVLILFVLEIGLRKL